MTAKRPDWNSLTTKDQITQVSLYDDSDLSKTFNLPPSFFSEERKYFASLPSIVAEPLSVPHNPPKDLVISARRDLSFFEANFELFDNSIDKWRRMGAKRELIIRAEYDLNLRKGKYEDNAGGMDVTEVYKVFIPGETTNRNMNESVIGSFGMGAKKAIFRLTDGAKVVSCVSKEYSSTSEVPERWENVPNWETLDGRAEATQPGRTEIYLFKLFDPPTLVELGELIQKTGAVYKPLLEGSLLKKKIRIFVNDTPVEPSKGIPWSAPAGAEPRIFYFSHTFKNFLNTGNDVSTSFRFQLGLMRYLPGKGPDTEPDWGVDVYGNGRLVDKYLKDEFGFGSSGMSKQTQSNKYFRAELFIDGHSMGIPWDTHKREYLHDHPVSKFLRDRLRKVIKSYLTIAGNFGSDKELTKTVLQGIPFTGQPKSYALPENGVPAEAHLPKWTYGSRKNNKGASKKHQSDSNKNTGNGGEQGDPETEEKLISLSMNGAEYDDLLQRFDVNSEDELGAVIYECLENGVAFTLDSAELEESLKLFQCVDVGDLSERIKSQLTEKLGRRKKAKR